MKQINIDGVIGWDVLTTDVRAEFDAANGEDVDLTFSSPGGSVYEGLAIYNVLRDYKRAGGNITSRIIGMAGSMSSYIPLAAGKGNVIIEDNALMMIHPPWGGAVGNSKEMRKTADILDGLSSIIATAYSTFTGKSKDEIVQMMDDETYLFGQEIIDAGFADSMVPAGDGAEDKASALIMARASIKTIKDHFESDPDAQQMDKVLALITEMKGAVSSPKLDVVQKIPAVKAETTKEEVKNMNLDQFKMENPDVFAEAVKLGETTERERRNSLKSQASADPDNADLQALINSAIETGISATDLGLQTKISVAVRNGKSLAGENPETVATTPDVPALSAEDMEAAELMDMTPEEYRKFSKEVE